MKTFGTWVLGFIVAVALIVGIFSIRIIDIGKSCAWVRFGKVYGEAVPGFQFVNMFNHAVCYPRQSILFQTAADVNGDGKVDSQADYYDFPVEIKTSDGQSAMLEFNLKWHVEPQCAVTIRTNIASNTNDLVMRVVNNFSRSIPRDIAPNYSATELYGQQRVDYENDIRIGVLATENRPEIKGLTSIFASECVVLDEFILRDINFDPAYEQVMENKQIEMENVTVQRHVAEQAVENAKATVTNAKANADAAIEAARGQAETTRLIAIAEAEAMRVKGQSLQDYPEMISLKFFDALTTSNWSLVPWSAVQGYLPITPPSVEIK
jgi:regulator of protease activity HflC (stomatin/prohibitin superfamily)